MRIAIGSDETGNALKQQLTANLTATGHEVLDPTSAIEPQTRA